jgi:ATPase family associated with various cellular activities (AAA)
MEATLNSAGQQFGQLLNLFAMKRVNTGDRMMDTTLQMLLSTIIGAAISAFIQMYTKALWRELWAQFQIRWNSKTYSPLNFDPANASGTPKNGKVFLYLYRNELGMANVTLSWFYTHHYNKKFILSQQDNEIMFPFAITGGMDELLDARQIMNSIMTGVGRKLTREIFIPVWRGLDGEWVYVNTEGSAIWEGFSFYSDSGAALKECLDSLALHHERMKQYADKKALTGVTYTGKIMDLQEWTDKNERRSLGKISFTKTFDSMFFTEKESILKLFKGFKEKTLYPKHLPIDNKLGILLYGPPGTGKTGFISALANFLEKPVIMIDMSRVKTRSSLDVLFGNYGKDYILVFEEFDCMEGIQRRDTPAAEIKVPEDPNNPHLMYSMMLMANAKDKDNEEWKKEMAAARDRLDLGYLLRKLDGLESGDGRVIIATTNHPEKIDPALLRPGRLGIQLNLTRATHPMLKDIIGMVYKTTIPIEEVADIPELKWSPAQILQAGIQHPTAQDLLAYLRSSEPPAE